MPRTSAARAKKRAYHHGDLVAALVREALAVVERDGHESVSVREVAREVGVSAAAPFRHFRDRDDLLRAVALVGHERFAEAAREAMVAAGPDPLLRFRAVGLTTVRFAIRHPKLARLMHTPGMSAPPTTATQAQIEFLKEIAEWNLRLVRESQRHGSMREGDPAVLELAGVAFALGLSQMFIEGTLPREGGEALAERVLDVLGSGLIAPHASRREPT